MKTKPNLQQYTLDELIQISFSERAQALAEATIDVSQWMPALKKVYEVMRSGRWMTLAEIAFQSGYPEASVSARVRDLHNLKGIAYQKRKAKEGCLYEYRLIVSKALSDSVPLS
jgi:RIO-like serine/threonine protein kinase